MAKATAEQDGACLDARGYTECVGQKIENVGSGRDARVMSVCWLATGGFSDRAQHHPGTGRLRLARLAATAAAPPRSAPAERCAAPRCCPSAPAHSPTVCHPPRARERVAKGRADVPGAQCRAIKMLTRPLPSRPSVSNTLLSQSTSRRLRQEIRPRTLARFTALHIESSPGQSVATPPQ